MAETSENTYIAYTYSYTYETDKYGDEIKVVHVKDNGIGWWYPGEPETGAHKRK